MEESMEDNIGRDFAMTPEAVDAVPLYDAPKPAAYQAVQMKP